MSSLQANGRVDLLGHAPIALFDAIPVDVKPTPYLNATKGGWYNTPLSMAFFSTENVRSIQNQLRHTVYMKTGKTIAVQDYDTLKSIMRAVFLTASRNLAGDIQGQITRLNSHVLDISSKSVISSLTSYTAYIRDVSTLAVPMQLPTLSSTKGQDPLEFKRWF